MIYQRYLFKEISKLFFFFLGTALTLLIFFDLSTHFQALHHPHIPLQHVLFFEATQVMKLFNQLVCFVLLISALALYTSLNRHREWVILTACGVPKYRLLYPIIGFGMCVMLGLYAHNQWIAPRAHNWNHTFQNLYLKQNVAPTFQPSCVCTN